ncbi:MAG TPA: hypothetical protein VGC76_11205 [Pyrinomonadaceae bacterium]|jgi:predicted ester cyclase
MAQEYETFLHRWFEEVVKLKDGKIVEAWNEFDFMKMYRQLGALTLTLK